MVRVIKTIKGKRYYYEQKTTRVGTKFKTQSKYIGPVDVPATVTETVDTWSLEKADKYAERMRGHTVPGQVAGEAQEAQDLAQDMEAMEGGRVPQEATQEATNAPNESAPGGEPGAEGGNAGAGGEGGEV